MLTRYYIKKKLKQDRKLINQKAISLLKELVMFQFRNAMMAPKWILRSAYEDSVFRLKNGEQVTSENQRASLSTVPCVNQNSFEVNSSCLSLDSSEIPQRLKDLLSQCRKVN